MKPDLHKNVRWIALPRNSPVQHIGEFCWFARQMEGWSAGLNAQTDTLVICRMLKFGGKYQVIWQYMLWYAVCLGLSLVQHLRWLCSKFVLMNTDEHQVAILLAGMAQHYSFTPNLHRYFQKWLGICGLIGASFGLPYPYPYCFIQSYLTDLNELLFKRTAGNFMPFFWSWGTHGNGRFGTVALVSALPHCHCSSGFMCNRSRGTEPRSSSQRPRSHRFKTDRWETKIEPEKLMQLMQLMPRETSWPLLLWWY